MLHRGIVGAMYKRLNGHIAHFACIFRTGCAALRRVDEAGDEQGSRRRKEEV